MSSFVSLSLAGLLQNRHRSPKSNVYSLERWARLALEAVSSSAACFLM